MKLDFSLLISEKRSSTDNSQCLDYKSISFENEGDYEASTNQTLSDDSSSYSSDDDLLSS